jgi:hypothetical protein
MKNPSKMVSPSKHTALVPRKIVPRKATNYINRLEDENKALRKVIDAATEGLGDIRRYAMLPKYQGIENSGINKSDIILRVNEVLSNINTVAVENSLRI